MFKNVLLQVSRSTKIILLLMAIGGVIPGTTAAESPQRIISLAPNITEVLYDLGLGKKLVAVSAYCNYPPEVKEKPKIGGMSNPSLEAIIALKPDLVVLTDDGNPRMIAQRLAKLNIPTYVFRARRLADLPKEIRKLGIAVDVQDRAEQSARLIEKVFSGYSAKSRRLHAPALRKALFVVQPEPLIVAGPGTAIDDALNLLGLKNIAADAPNRYPHFSLEEVIRRSPDVIFIVKTHDNQSTRTIQFLKKLNHLKAIREGKVFYVGDPLLRMGPRITDGIDEIARYLEIDRN